MRKIHKKIFVFIIVLLVLSLAFNGYLMFFKKAVEAEIEHYGNVEEYGLNGFSLAEMNISYDGTIGLIKGCRALVAYTTEAQASSILEGLKGEIKNRPWTHDIIYDILEHYGLKVVMVRITDIKDGWFLSDLVVEDADGRVLSIDAKPSDAIAIAVRTNSYVYVNDSLYDKYGVSVCDE